MAEVPTTRYVPAAMRSRSRRRKTAPNDIDWRAILDSVPDVIYVLDLEGRFVYLNPRAADVFGYEREDRTHFVGRPVLDLVTPESRPAVMQAIRHRIEFPHDRQVFRVDGLHRNGAAIPLEVHGAAVVRDGEVVGRIGVCRVLEGVERADGTPARVSTAAALQTERMRIARGLRDAIAHTVFGVAPDRDASEAFLSDVRRATQADLARRLQLDAVDVNILRSVAAGASNREIAVQVHLSAAAVKDRLRRLMTRLGARRRAELAAHALRLGIA